MSLSQIGRLGGGVDVGRGVGPGLGYIVRDVRTSLAMGGITITSAWGRMT